MDKYFKIFVRFSNCFIFYKKLKSMWFVIYGSVGKNLLINLCGWIIKGYVMILYLCGFVYYVCCYEFVVSLFEVYVFFENFFFGFWFFFVKNI